MKIKELKQMVGVEGISFEGKIEDVYEINTGHHEQYGDWTLQNILISDDTDKILVSLRNREEFDKKLKGRKVKFTSSYNEKQGKNMGAKIVKETYEKDGKEQVVIKAVITPSCVIDFGEMTKTSKEPESKENEPKESDNKTNSMLISYAKDIVVAGIEKGWYKDSADTGVGLTKFYNLMKNLLEGKKDLEEVKNNIEPDEGLPF